MYYQIWMLLVAVGMWVGNTQACSCQKQHPQEAFCNMDFVMQVHLRSEGEISYKKTEHQNYDPVTQQNTSSVTREAINKKYSVKVRKVYKVKENSVGLSSNTTVTTLYTSASSSLCGVDLYVRTTYLVSGYYHNGQLNLDMCSWNTPWAWMTKMQRKYLKSIYNRNCDCQIQDEAANLMGLDTNQLCMFAPFTPRGTCSERHSACIKDKNSTTGGCKWHRNSSMKKCREESRSPNGRMVEP